MCHLARSNSRFRSISAQRGGVSVSSNHPAAPNPNDTLAIVYDTLVKMYGVPEWKPDGDALGGLIGTILSQHTSDVNSKHAYQRLTQRFPTWETVRDACTAAVEEAIRPGGLGNIKAHRIQHVLRELTLRLNGGPLTLAALDDMS